MIKSVSLSAFVAALGAASALAATPQEIAACQSKLAEVHKYRTQGLEERAKAAEREASDLCVCEAKQDPMISRLGEWTHLG